MKNEVDLIDRLEAFHEFATKTKKFMDADLYQKVIDELTYLRFFYCECDFGPAHEDVVYFIDQRYEEETGKEVPEGYRDGE